MAKILKNPTNEIVEFMHNGIPYVFKPGESKALEEGAAKLALEFNNTKLVDAEVVTKTEGPKLTDLSMPELYKLAKAKGIKAKIGTTKQALIDLLSNG